MTETSSGMHADATRLYEGWRRLFLSGGDSNAIAALRFHGLWGALSMAGGAGIRPQPLPPSADAGLSVAGVAIAEAASQIRSLLLSAVPPAIICTPPEHVENRHA